MSGDGYFEVRTAEDLLEKIRHDLERMKRNPADSYAALDFFTTALSMKYWPGGEGLEGLKRKGSPLWSVCEHIGHGVKHFTVNKHNSVASTVLEGSAFDSKMVQPNAYQVGRLVVHLEPELAAQLGGPVVDAIGLAESILEQCEQQVKLSRAKATSNL